MFGTLFRGCTTYYQLQSISTLLNTFPCVLTFWMYCLINLELSSGKTKAFFMKLEDICPSQSVFSENNNSQLIFFLNAHPVEMFYLFFKIFKNGWTWCCCDTKKYDNVSIIASKFLEQKPRGHFVPLWVFFHSRLSCPQQKGTGRTVCFPNGRQEHCDPCVVEGAKLLSLLVLCKRALILLTDSRAHQRCTFLFFFPSHRSPFTSNPPIDPDWLSGIL